MKLLQLHAGYRTPAGEDTVVAAEAEALRTVGHTVRQHIVRNPTATGAALAALARSRYNRKAADDVRRAIDEFEPDVVHVHNTWFALSSSVLEATSARNVPLVMTVHNYRVGCVGGDLFRSSSICTACVGRSPIRGVVHGCYRDSRVLSAIAAVEVMSSRRRSVFDHVDRFVAPSAFMRDRLVDIGVPAERLSVKPHFTRDVGARLQPPSASDEILFIGRLAPGKGLPTLLRAWERRERSDDGPQRLVIVGDGPLAATLHESAPRDVEFAGWLPYEEVQQKMLSARGLVFPSEWYEPFGMVLIEAMSAGLPVIATTASDAARITGTHEDLVTTAGDDRSLANALAALTRERVDEAGAAARRRFLECYDESSGVAALLDLYESVISEHRA